MCLCLGEELSAGEGGAGRAPGLLRVATSRAGRGALLLKPAKESPFSTKRSGAPGRLSLCPLRQDVLLPRRDLMPLPRLAFPNWLLENSSARADPAVGGFGWFLVGPIRGALLSLADAALTA